MIAIYTRVSTGEQSTRGQEKELQQWATLQENIDVEWFKDKATGLKMSRPGMERMLQAIRSGRATKVVVWRLDRLGRTAKGLLEFFEELQSRGTGFLSLRDSIDLSTPSGRLLLTILAGVAQFETEVRSERQRAGIAAIREKNGGKCTWGGRRKGTSTRRVSERELVIRSLLLSKCPITEIQRVTGVSRPTIYRIQKSILSQSVDSMPSTPSS